MTDKPNSQGTPMPANTDELEEELKRILSDFLWETTDYDEAEAALLTWRERVVQEAMKQAADRFDDQVFRHWGIHSDHDEIKRHVFELEKGGER